MLLQKSNIDQQTTMKDIITKRTALHTYLEEKKTNLEADLKKANGTLDLLNGQTNNRTEQLNDKIKNLNDEIQRDYKAQIEYDIKVLTEELNIAKTQESGHGLNADSTSNSLNLDKQLKTKNFILDFLNENSVELNPVINDEDELFPLPDNKDNDIEMITLNNRITELESKRQIDNTPSLGEN
jgi:hypothetical protein